jgi:hypothetical protein
MVFTPFTMEDFEMLDGSRVGANTIHERLMLLMYAVNRALKQRNIECASVVANPVITRNTDARRAGWAGWLPTFAGIPDPTLNPLSIIPSVSVFVMSDSNFKAENRGLEIVTEFGEGKRLIEERDAFYRNIVIGDILSFTFLGKEMALKLRGKPDTISQLDSPESFASFQRNSLKRYDSKSHYAVAGRFLSPAEAIALGKSTVEVIAESVRRLLLLFSNFKSG